MGTTWLCFSIEIQDEYSWTQVMLYMWWNQLVLTERNHCWVLHRIDTIKSEIKWIGWPTFEYWPFVAQKWIYDGPNQEYEKNIEHNLNFSIVFSWIFRFLLDVSSIFVFPTETSFSHYRLWMHKQFLLYAWLYGRQGNHMFSSTSSAIW